MAKELVLFSMLLVLAACSHAAPSSPDPTPAPTPTPIVTPTPAPNYYPIKNGTSYTYRHQENGVLMGELVISFSGVQQQGDQTLAIADKIYNLTGNTMPPQSDRLTISTSSIDFAFNQDNGVIYNRFVLPIVVGSRWNFSTPDRDHSFLVSELADVVTSLGVFSKCAHLVEHGENSLVTTDVDYWLANGVGLVKYRYRQTVKGQDAPYIEVVDELFSFR